MHWAKVGKLTKVWRQKVIVTALRWLSRSHAIPIATDQDHRLIKIIWRAPQARYLPDHDNALAALKHTVTDNLRYKRYKRAKSHIDEDGKQRFTNVLSPSKIAVIYDDNPAYATFEYVPIVEKGPRNLTVEIYAHGTTRTYDPAPRRS